MMLLLQIGALLLSSVLALILPPIPFMLITAALLLVAGFALVYGHLKTFWGLVFISSVLSVGDFSHG